MSLWDYPVTFVYGFSAAYGPDFHYGEDRTCPVGTPVTVNGVIIGYSGNTGLSTGPHCHIGKWIGGQSYNPSGGGASFSSATVTEVHPTDTDNNGKYVRVQGDGYSWVYLHLSSVNVKVGDILKEEIVEPADYRANEGDVINVYQGMLGRQPSAEEIKIYVGEDFKTILYAFMGSAEFQARVNGNGPPPTLLKKGRYEVQ